MSGDIRTSSLQSPVDLVEYLFRRLRQVGIKSVHGVPGDYNLVALDSLSKCDLEWVGSVNELNAGYATDGYARINGIGAMITTFGVGELSALNAVAGSYSEYVPVIHIVGTPSTISQANGMLLHHTCSKIRHFEAKVELLNETDLESREVGNGDFRVFANMSANISCVSSHLNDPMNAAQLVDHAIKECYLKSRPAYITLPTDMVGKKVEGERLKTPLDLSYPENNPAQEDYAVENILKHLQTAKKPVILVDACAIRHRALEEVHALIEKSNLPTFVTPMGKGAVNETLPNYSGVYAGNGSHPDVQEMVESSDLILSFGAIKSDFNTAGFTYHTSQLSTIDFHSNYVAVKYSEYHGLRMNGVINKIVSKLGSFKLNVQPPLKPTAETDEKSQDGVITHSWFWPRLDKFVKEDDVIVTETGTSGYGIWEVKFKRGIRAISQILWGSIGYATGAAQGAALAAKEEGKGRTILFTGDGSFQLTAQELSTMIRRRLNPIVFIICNNGFTIERFIHGMEASYNDIAAWKYKDLPAVFDAKQGEYKTYQVKTKSQVEELLADNEFASSNQLRLVELYMPQDDAPKALVMTAEASAKNNAKT